MNDLIALWPKLTNDINTFFGGDVFVRCSPQLSENSDALPVSEDDEKMSVLDDIPTQALSEGLSDSDSAGGELSQVMFERQIFFNLESAGEDFKQSFKKSEIVWMAKMARPND